MWISPSSLSVLPLCICGTSEALVEGLEVSSSSEPVGKISKFKNCEMARLVEVVGRLSTEREKPLVSKRVLVQNPSN